MPQAHLSTHPQERPLGRSFLLDLLKAIGCVLIVAHHLAFYGPMADVAGTAWPAALTWLQQHARLSVQMFLVCSGFLTAQAMLALQALTAPQVWRAMTRRYLRLAIPLLTALALTVLVSELIRPWFAHHSLSAMPSWGQVLAHVFFLQHLLDMEALSAGVWYVAVDLQLYVFTLLVVWLAQWLHAQDWGQWRRWQGLFIAVLMLLSLTDWTHREALDDTALFFWGAYGMGWLAWQVRAQGHAGTRWGLMLALGVLSLAFDERWRAVTAWAVACLLACAPVRWMGPGPEGQWWVRSVHWLSRISYAVFVIHFSVALLVNFAVQALWPASVAMNALGMVLAIALALLAGEVLHRLTEQGRPSWKRWLACTLAFALSSALAMYLQA